METFVLSIGEGSDCGCYSLGSIIDRKALVPTGMPMWVVPLLNPRRLTCSSQDTRITLSTHVYVCG